MGPERNFIGYGREGFQTEWPDQAKLAINFVINYEEGSEVSFSEGDGCNEHHGGEEEYPFPAGIRDLAQESVFEYGSRAGIWRILRIFDEYDIKATFSACALAFEKNPAVAAAAATAGHDLLSHGYRWIEYWNLTREEEADHFKKAIASFEQTWGSRPEGWYCRYGPSVNTRALVVADGGFIYDSDSYGDDLPYWVKVSGKDHLVVPYSLTNNDLQGDKSPALFVDYCKRAIDELWVEGHRGSPKMMSIGLHPRIIGQPARASGLREIVEYARGKSNVWFARRLDIANWWRQHYPPAA